jgi:hypothetical protein
MMIYINYPDPHLTLHSTDSCPEVRKHRKQAQRILAITSRNLGNVLSQFIDHEIRFGVNRSSNDLWLHVSLDSQPHEEALAYVIHAILRQRYRRFKNAPIRLHACHSQRHRTITV